MKRMSEVFELPVIANIYESVGSITSAEGAMNLTVHELANYCQLPVNERVAARSDAAEIIAHAINHVDVLADALAYALDVLAHCKADAGYSSRQTKAAIAGDEALKAYRGEK